MLKWSGKRNGRPVEGTVHGGAAFGSFEVTSEVEAMVAAGARVSEGPFSGAADLSDPQLARAAIRACLDEGSAKFEGDEAPEAKLPEGVVS